MGFELVTPASERPQTHALDRAATKCEFRLCVRHPEYMRDVSLENNKKKSVQTGLPAEIRNGHLSDKSHKRCRLILPTPALGVTQNILQIGFSTTGIRSKRRRA